MKNFIFKSEADFHKIIFNKLDMVLAEQRHQRSNLALLIRIANRDRNSDNLQKQVDQYFEDSSQEEKKVNDQLVIKTAVKQRRPGLPSKRPFGTLYKIAKESLQYLGYYEDIKQYDPGYYFERYSYKPRKRLTGYAFQTKGFLRKKKRYGSGYKFNQECFSGSRWNNSSQSFDENCKSS